MLKLQYSDHVMQRADSSEKTLMLGKTEGKRMRGEAEDEMVRSHHRLNSQECEQTPGDTAGQREAGVLQSMGLQRAGHDVVIEEHVIRGWSSPSLHSCQAGKSLPPRNLPLAAKASPRRGCLTSSCFISRHGTQSHLTSRV